MRPIIETGCCIVGGGPAGMMAGLLLARAGVEVIVLEKHGDFLRDFRGDTVHPSTLELMQELGVLSEFLARPHTEVRELGGEIEGERVMIADFSHLRTACKFIALMPQWDFLDFVADQARRSPTFRLLMNAEATSLVRLGDQITGVVATTKDGPVEVRARLTIGADGRHSVVRAQAHLDVQAFGAPIDVLWMRLPRRESDRSETLGIIRGGHVFVMLNRGDYWQCAFVIPKGGFAALKDQGLETFRQDIRRTVPFLGDRVAELQSWEDIKLLTVMVDRLRQWHAPGLLCIGDAAHAMSPIGGVGINLAIQDAVAAANLLYRPLLANHVTSAHLASVQRRRMLPTRLTQAVQLFLQERVIGRVIAAGGPVTLPLPARLLRDHRFLRRIPAWLVGIGIRPEHIRTPAQISPT